ncbi:MAG: helix-turn-helix domain-containing protein [Actinomycetota bacterium]|nr:helix-turn-helix domain-containing protein [Actinomycetota bacterium]
MDRITVDIDKEWLAVPDICDYMGVSAFVVTSQLRSGGLPAVKFGREWRVARGDFEDWINAQRMHAGSGTSDHTGEQHR